MTDNDLRTYSPSAARNKAVIAEAFQRLLPSVRTILEIGSGTGEHAEEILRSRAGLTWQGSDADPHARASTTTRMTALGQPAALELDTRQDGWWQTVDGPFDAVVAINVVHITDRQGYENLFRGASALLGAGSALFLYGPMSRRGALEPSNQRFDQSLQSRDPVWGVRDLDDTLQPLGARFALELDSAERVPANNHVVVFRKDGREES
jgi:cyclopropane fatty-acyl-phospholipid synthase-like methyltransferase